MSTERPSTTYQQSTSIDAQLSADLAEQRGVNRIVLRRWEWVGACIEVICIARALRVHNLDEAQRHANHLQVWLMRLRGQGAEKENDREPSLSRSSKEARISGRPRTG